MDVNSISPEDLSREIESLWAHLSDASISAPPPPTAPPPGAELAWETLAMIETRQRRRESALIEMIAAKEESLKHWRARASSLQAEVVSLNARAANSDKLVYEQLLDAQQRLEGAFYALDQERSTHEAERRLLKEALDSLRIRVNAEAERTLAAEAQFRRREEEHGRALQDALSAAENRQEKIVQAERAGSILKASLAEAKNALEKTFAELLRERRARGGAAT